ncbi:DUF3151 domain-containing protein [Lipingzhangella sp. LS1_29]|uniref:DUF3151 domain-containing protein n=1 Tax=Lipingzhangella rawalii TaxID=2055835 RepID=A0ABU2H864_9ACTN|nr:DUF3151 domain-containing protein [Lipingzhangella rawalii]MDS1271496.1 DUF3151 domain-containing protein [Lipingzhangella rawalii]
MSLHNHNLLGDDPPTHLPDDSEPRAALANTTDPRTVAARFPDNPGVWAELAMRSLDSGESVTAYAYARTGYHRGLDQLRRSGWKGHGPIPWEHEPNRGFLRALYALSRAAANIAEDHEAERCAQLLRDSSPTAVTALEENGALPT